MLSLHLTPVLASSWMVNFSLNIVPLMTFTRQPEDPPYKLWELIGVLSFVAVLIPLVTPRHYVLFDLSVSYESNVLIEADNL